MALSLELLKVPMQRTFIIGDVHGCLSELEALVARAGVTADDQLIFVGDLVAKGPDSQGVVQFAREHKARAVLGNHDDHLLSAHHGGPAGKHHTEVEKTLKKADWQYLEALPLFIELPEAAAVVVHAGLLPGVALDKQPRHLLLNLRSIRDDGSGSTRLDAEPWASQWRGPQRVFFGHDAVRGLQKYRHALGLDTGCVYGKQLTGVWLHDRQVVSVKAERTWQQPKGGE